MEFEDVVTFSAGEEDESVRRNDPREAKPPAAEKPKESKQETQIQTVDVAELANSLKDEILARLPKPQKQEMTAGKESHLARQIKSMLDSGVDPNAVAQLVALQEAAKRDEDEKTQVQTAQQRQQKFVDDCWEIGFQATKKVVESIPAIADEDEDFVKLMTRRVSEEIRLNNEHRTIKDAMSQGRHPDKKAVEKVAAKVVDKYLEKHGITKPSPTVAIRTNKPASINTEEFNLQALPKQARELYHLSKKFTDEKTARSRALEFAKG